MLDLGQQRAPHYWKWRVKTNLSGLKNNSADVLLHIHIMCFYLPGPAVITVEEGRNVILPCSLSTKENIQLLVWRKVGQTVESLKEVFTYDGGLHHNNGRSGQDEQFKGRVFHFSEGLKHGNGSIIIRHTKAVDSGEYTCFFPLQQNRETFHIKLVVGEYIIELLN